FGDLLVEVSCRNCTVGNRFHIKSSTFCSAPQPFPRRLRIEATVPAKCFSTCPFGLQSKCNGRKKRDRKMNERDREETMTSTNLNEFPTHVYSSSGSNGAPEPPPTASLSGRTPAFVQRPRDAAPESLSLAPLPFPPPPALPPPPRTTTSSLACTPSPLSVASTSTPSSPRPSSTPAPNAATCIRPVRCSTQCLTEISSLGML
ncbi:hypothetical protein MUK42_09065, partial [Musa troglodytarum]